MKVPSIVFVVVFVILAFLHQDSWNWDNANLVFGLIPVGLAYHAAFSILAAMFWALVIHFAWPRHLEKWADGEDGEDS